MGGQYILHRILKLQNGFRRFQKQYSTIYHPLIGSWIQNLQKDLMLEMKSVWILFGATYSCLLTAGNGCLFDLLLINDTLEAGLTEKLWPFDSTVAISLVVKQFRCLSKQRDLKLIAPWRPKLTACQCPWLCPSKLWHCETDSLLHTEAEVLQCKK